MSHSLKATYYDPVPKTGKPGWPVRRKPRWKYYRDSDMPTEAKQEIFICREMISTLHSKGILVDGDIPLVYSKLGGRIRLKYGYWCRNQCKEVVKSEVN